MMNYYPSPARIGAAPIFDDTMAMAVVNAWKKVFPDATPLPGIGLPSQNQGVLTMTHTMDPKLTQAMPMTINNLKSRSPLANNALYSLEISDGHWLHLYETMLPDIPGKEGEASTGQKYADRLAQSGISVAGNHYHWSGGLVMGHFALAIHSQAANMDPFVFASRQIDAYRATGIPLPGLALPPLGG